MFLIETSCDGVKIRVWSARNFDNYRNNDLYCFFLTNARLAHVPTVTEDFNSLAFAMDFTMSDRNIVYIGSKPINDYCLAVLSSLQGDGSTVHLKARGRAISTAVDVAEVTRNRFLKELTVDNVEIGTEELENQDGQMRNVSTITITLKKG